MASWVAHLRVADKMKELFKGHEYAFYTGNLAPDGGKINSDGTYTPQKEITHWYTIPGEFSITPDAFADYYIIGKSLDGDKSAFLWGYYCHLYTDALYHELLMSVYERFCLEKCWQTRRNMYATATDIDYIYLNENPDGSVTGFINGFSKFENDIIEYFEKDGLTLRIKQICQFYKDIQGGEYKPSGINYFSPSEIETLVSRTASELGERIGIAIS